MDLQTVTMSVQMMIMGLIIIGLVCFVVGLVYGVKQAQPQHGYRRGERM